MRTSRLRVTVGLVSTIGLAWGCAMLIGADEERELARPGTLGEEAGRATDPAPRPCPADQKACGEQCFPRTWEFGCGGPGCDPCSLPFATATACDDAGACVATGCAAGFQFCSGACVEVSHERCLDCRTSCLTTNVCRPGSASLGAICTPSCLSPSLQCGLTCVDPTRDPRHCGGCNAACDAGLNEDPTCSLRVCGARCRPGYGSCDGGSECLPLPVFYLDGDGDRFGTAGTARRACSPSASSGTWTAFGGDCDDGNPDVFPGQTRFFATPHDAGGRPSFDYDCDGLEEPPTDAPRWTSCATCAGQGYLAAADGRAGPGVDPACGSTRFATCRARVGSVCDPVVDTDAGALPCR